MLDKKGFLFTVTIFLILTYILISISVWVKAIETSESSYSEFYKESTVELTIEQITPMKMDNVTNILMSRGLERLDEHTITNPVLPGNSVENKNTQSALFELLMNGSANQSYFYGGVGIPTESNSSLQTWENNLNASLRAIGVYVDQFNVTNFQVGQSDINLVNYSFDLTLGIKDYTNTSSISRNYHISNSIDISGLIDPALARMSANEPNNTNGNLTIYREFFFDKTNYSNYSDISISKLPQTVSEGQGWIYGPLAMANGSSNLIPNINSIPPSQQSSYILVGTFQEIEDAQPNNGVNGIYDQSAGYIITSAPVTSSCNNNTNEANTLEPIQYTSSSNGSCNVISIGPPTTSKPFIVAPGFNPTSAPTCPSLDTTNTTRRCVLMINSHLPQDVASTPTDKMDNNPSSGLYDVELMRDFVMCGYYTHNPAAPSYLQRLLTDSYSRNDSTYGIETFVIGNYANDYGIYDTNSRLDRELFNSSISAIKVRGLPGCRNYQSCADSPITGIFAVGPGAETNYGLGQIACDNGAAGCSS